MTEVRHSSQGKEYVIRIRAHAQVGGPTSYEATVLECSPSDPNILNIVMEIDSGTEAGAIERAQRAIDQLK